MLKRLFIFLLVCLPFLITAQKDVQLFEKERDWRIIIYAKNVSKKDLRIDLRIESTGLNLSNAMPLAQILKAGATEEAITLTPTPGQAWSYKTSLSYRPVDDKGSGYTINSSNISKQTIKGLTAEKGFVLYTKPECGRCRQARSHLSDKGVRFKEVDLSTQTSEVDAMWLALWEQGFSGKQVKTPVIQVDGKLFYEMKDIPAFLDEMMRRKM